MLLARLCEIPSAKGPYTTYNAFRCYIDIQVLHLRIQSQCEFRDVVPLLTYCIRFAAVSVFAICHGVHNDMGDLSETAMDHAIATLIPGIMTAFIAQKYAVVSRLELALI